MRVIGGFFSTKADVREHGDMTNVKRFSLNLQYPHWNGGISQVCLVEVKDDGSVFNNLLHDITSCE